MRQKFRIHKVQEALYRVWQTENPDKSFTVDARVGFCSCKKFPKCSHPKIIEDYLDPPGASKPIAREVAQTALETYRADPWIRSAKIVGSNEKQGLITHIRMEITVRGKGKPVTMEGRISGINIAMRFRFDIDLPTEPLLLYFDLMDKPPTWEKVF